MADSTGSKAPTRILLRDVTLSYPHLTTPKQNDQSKKWQYDSTFLFPVNDPFDNAGKCAAAINQIMVDKFGADGPKFLVPTGKHKSPLHLGEGELRDPKDPTKFKFDPTKFGGFIGARTPAKEKAEDCGLPPQVAHPYADPNDPTGKRPAVMSLAEVKALMYPGAIVNATINFYYYNNASQGVGVGLSNLQFVRNGDRLDSRTNAADEFSVIAETVVSSDIADLMK